VAAIESGFVQNAIADNAFHLELARERGEAVVVGVNRYAAEEEVEIPAQRIDEDAVRRQIERVRAFKAAQDREIVSGALSEVSRVAETTDENILSPMREALRVGATLGEVANALRAVFGEYRAPG
jgi:methylmalonyl-CoA mutase N-terminal domain/subunit